MEAGTSRPVNTNGGSLTTNRAMGHAQIPLSTRLLGAAVAGDWEVAEEILRIDPELATARLTPSGETALHVAAAAAEGKQEYFVNKFLEKLPNHDLTITNQAGNTALHLAALAGNKKIAEPMVSKNTNLPTISNNQQVRPIFLAAMSGNGEMVEYLLPYSNFGVLDDNERSKILNTYIDAGLYGVARNIVKQYTILAFTKDQNGETPLDVLARKRSAFSSRSSQTRGWWRTIYALPRLLSFHCSIILTKNSYSMEAGTSRPVNTNGGSLTTNRAMGHAQIPLSTRLLGAAVAGDWEVAEEILRIDPELATARLTPSGETALHVAAAAAEGKQEYFVNKFLEKLPDLDLTITNQAGSTALHLAALAGNKKIAEPMVSKNTNLPTISNNQQVRPIFLAAMSGNGEMVEYLLPYSNFGVLDDNERSKILNTCIDAGLYGIARNIVKQYTILAFTKDQNGETPLDVLARKRSAFSSRSSQTRGWWRTIYAMCCKKIARGERPAKPDDVFQLLELIWQQVPRQDIENPNIAEDIARPAFVAAELGNYEFLVELLRQRPEFLYIVNRSSQSIYHIAVKNRYVSIFSLIHEIGKLKYLVASYRDDENNTMLHLAADNVPQSQLTILPGAALQMHRELLWYKEVEEIVPPTYRNIRNKTDNKTPHELFIEKHKSLMEEGEKWMKKTAPSCMVVATLITTVVFTTAFTVPGGSDNQTGEPLLRHHGFFLLFAIAEIIAMLSSITSISMFLCILTSRYTERDFLESLPFWLVSGIVTLFISVAGMMVAFCACFLLYDRHSSAKVPILLGVFGCMPMMLAILKYPLLSDIIGSIYAARRLFRSRQRLTSKDLLL